MDYVEFIVSKDGSTGEFPEPAKREIISEKYDICSYDPKMVGDISIEKYSYSAIPKVLTTQNDALDAAGILKLQTINTLSLNGQGVFVALIDTGVRGISSYASWDQSEGEEREDAAGAEHGTFLASVIRQAVPEADLISVRLRRAPDYLREYYYIPDGAEGYSEADIMRGVAYAHRLALQERRPLVICLGLGCNNGSHLGSSPLSDYLTDIAGMSGRAVVVAAGNQANERLHFHGKSQSLLSPVRVELNVERDMRGFYIEFWGIAPEQFAVAVQSPSGVVMPRSMPVTGVSDDYRYSLEDADLRIDYREPGRNRRDQLIFLRLDRAVKGIWNLMVYPGNVIRGDFDIWLPMQELLSGPVYFLESDPDTTITMPADALGGLTIGSYDQKNNALDINSGRGYEPDGTVKPDLLAPGIQIPGVNARGDRVAYSGSSAACAIAAGACAQLMEWAFVRGNAPGFNTTDLKNLLIRGAKRPLGGEYPSPKYGYGMLDVYESFRLL